MFFYLRFNKYRIFSYIKSLIPCNGKMCPTDIDKKVANRTNRVKLGYPTIILLVHEPPSGRTLPLRGINVFKLLYI